MWGHAQVTTQTELHHQAQKYNAQLQEYNGKLQDDLRLSAAQLQQLQVCGSARARLCLVSSCKLQDISSPLKACSAIVYMVVLSCHAAQARALFAQYPKGHNLRMHLPA